MATSVFFNNYNNFNEQNLIDDLVIESIRIFGIDVIYITKSFVAIDKVLNEDDLSVYDQTFEFEAYVKNVDGFEGEGDFLSKFGLQIRDSVTFTVANRTFEKFVTKENTNKIRPFEGDLIYFPLNEKIFEIKHVEHESVFYQTGALQVYDMKCELIEYSGQRFQTGRDNIDTYFDSINTEILSSNTSTLTALEDIDPISRNLAFEQEGDGILDFTEIDPFSENITIQDS
jgi:hypothetical protein